MSCSVDMLGFFASRDLDSRLLARNEFVLFQQESEILGYDVLKRDFGDEYSFLVLSDTHIENENPNGLERLKNAVVENDAAFVVFLGDNTQNGRRQDLQVFVNIALSLGVPCYPVLGNHDIYFENYPVWKELVGSSSYRAAAGGTLLLVFDSANGMAGGMQLDWIESELKNTSARHIFVFTHTNLFVESMTDIVQWTDNRERARLISLLRGRNVFMFSGHVHKRIIREAAGTVFVSMEDYKQHKTYAHVFVRPEGTSYVFKKL
ncbi:MAG: metallophosphoesterase [Spirochaetaceae bacterium]|nr:metallophosphoesterase [Spirochaetaceae bacterium]